MNVLLTGASGFLGSHILEHLIQNDYNVYCLLRQSHSPKWIQNLNFKTIFFESHNLTQKLNHIDFDIDYVVHSAGATQALNIHNYIHANYHLTQKLIHYSAKNQSIKRFIFISSQAVAGPSKNHRPIKESQLSHPISDYGITKLLAEQSLYQYSHTIPIIILRPCSIYGPRDASLLPLFQALKYHLALFPNYGKNLVNLIYVQDLAQLVILCLSLPCPSPSTFFVNDGNVYSWKSILQIAQQTYQKKYCIPVHIPSYIFKSIGLLNDFISSFSKKPQLLNSQKINEILQSHWLCDASNIQKISHWKPHHSLQLGFQKTLQFYQQYSYL